VDIAVAQARAAARDGVLSDAAYTAAKRRILQHDKH
jgi:hypothetical protein